MVLELNEKNFEKNINGLKIPIIIDFWASWCGPCQMMVPIFHQLSNDFDGRIKFAKLSTEDFPEISRKCNVMSIPCLIVFNKGKEVDRITGFMPAPMLKNNIERILNKIKQFDDSK